MNKNSQLLDCTLRDGGFALEDFGKNAGENEMVFKSAEIEKIVEHSVKSNIDIIELGAVEISKDCKKKYAIYQNLQEISKTKKQSNNKKQMYAAMYRGPDTPVEDIPPYSEDLCECVRVILRYSELKKSLDFCEALSKKGYKVFIQPMLTMRYTAEELDLIIEYANKIDAYALYIVDSYGYMQNEDVLRLFNIYDKKLKNSVRIGFHAHDNMNLAFSNSLYFANIDTERAIVIDSCVLGMGQGAGNLQTELIVTELNKKTNKNYDFTAVLQIAEIIQQYLPEKLWGFDLVKFLPTIHKIAYKYSSEFRDTYHLSFVEIDSIFSNFPKELMNRYTESDAKNIIDNKHLYI